MSSDFCLAGSFAGFMNAFAASPIELLKIRLQAQRSKGNLNGPIAVASQLIKEQGIKKGLFRGLWVTICKEIPAYAGFYAGTGFVLILTFSRF